MSNLVPSQDLTKEWRENPVRFVYDNFKVDPDPWQRKVLMAFPHEQRIAMKACKGPGKTGVLSWLAWNFLATRPHPKIAATSITSDNLSDGLWTEMSKWQQQSEYLKHAFKWNKTRIHSIDHPETWWMSARTWAKGASAEQQADALAGLHAEYVLFLLDESGGIPDSVMAAAEAALSTGTELKLVMAGNPTHLEGPLYRACTSERHLWYLVEITGDPDDPDRAQRISKVWAQQQIDKYGRDNPWVLVNVFGRFPPSSINTLLGPDEVSQAMKRHLRIDQYDFSQKRLGIDCARFGDDSTVIFPRQGLAAFKPVQLRNARSNEIAARVMAAKNRWGSELEFVDGTGGFGSGVVDSLIQVGSSPYEINFGGKAINPRYMNKRAEMWFEMSEWVKRGGALPPDNELSRELTAPTYTFTKTGQLQLESKDQIKDRLGFSPDKADALALTFALPDMPKALPEGFRRQSIKSDYDPYADRQPAGIKSEYDPFGSQI